MVRGRWCGVRRARSPAAPLRWGWEGKCVVWNRGRCPRWRDAGAGRDLARTNRCQLSWCCGRLRVVRWCVRCRGQMPGKTSSLEVGEAAPGPAGRRSASGRGPRSRPGSSTPITITSRLSAAYSRSSGGDGDPALLVGHVLGRRSAKSMRIVVTRALRDGHAARPGRGRPPRAKTSAGKTSRQRSCPCRHHEPLRQLGP